MNKNINYESNNSNINIIRKSLENNKVQIEEVNLLVDDFNEEDLIVEENDWLPDYEKDDSSWSYIYKLINKNKQFFLYFLAYTLITNAIIFLLNNSKEEKSFISSLEREIERSLSFINLIIREGIINLLITIIPFFTIFLFPILDGLFRKFFKWMFKRNKIWKLVSFIFFLNSHPITHQKGSTLSIISIMPISFILVEVYDKTDNNWVSINLNLLNNATIVGFHFLLKWISNKK